MNKSKPIPFSCPRCGAKYHLVAQPSAELTATLISQDGPVAIADIADGLDNEIDAMWGIIAALITIENEHRGDPFIAGVLQLANAHLGGLVAIRRDVSKF